MLLAKSFELALAHSSLCLIRSYPAFFALIRVKTLL
jgi:hypothetical protein